MGTPPLNVLFLCTGNSARSILAEALLNQIGKGRFNAYSAGSHPIGEVNPLAIELLHRSHISADSLRSKNWNEFAGAGAPNMDFVFTVCDAAAEACPSWPGQPMTAHWGVPDPAGTDRTPDEANKAFWQAFQILRRRIELFAALPIEKLNRLALKTQLDEIGNVSDARSPT